MPELMATMTAKQEADYDAKKFAAALKGVDLDKENNAGRQKFDELYAKATSKGRTENSKDILALSGTAAQQAGFGIGVGLDYQVI